MKMILMTKEKDHNTNEKNPGKIRKPAELFGFAMPIFLEQSKQEHSAQYIKYHQN